LVRTVAKPKLARCAPLVQTFAGLGVARHKAPERVEAVTDLPRTAIGKVRKTELRALLRTERRPAPWLNE
jgi:non-ribosomal peptide synthetase component E (peptide arylation enzyme)